MNLICLLHSDTFTVKRIPQHKVTALIQDLSDESYLHRKRFHAGSDDERFPIRSHTRSHTIIHALNPTKSAFIVNQAIKRLSFVRFGLDYQFLGELHFFSPSSVSSQTRVHQGQIQKQEETCPAAAPGHPHQESAGLCPRPSAEPPEETSEG